MPLFITQKCPYQVPIILANSTSLSDLIILSFVDALTPDV